MINLRLDNLTFSHPAGLVLEHINWAIQHGQKIGLVGPNGAGKSTLLKLLTGELTPDDGFVFKAKGVTDKELKKVKNSSIDYLIRAMSSNSGLAHHLGYYEALAGDWRFLFDLIESMQSVTKEDVQRVAQTYLTKSNRTVATLVKKP